MANDKLARKIFSLTHPTVEALNEVINGIIRVENKVDALRSESKRRQMGVNATINQVSNDSELNKTIKDCSYPLPSIHFIYLILWLGQSSFQP